MVKCPVWKELWILVYFKGKYIVNISVLKLEETNSSINWKADNDPIVYSYLGMLF